MQHGGEQYDPKAKARRPRSLWRAITAERLALGVVGTLFTVVVIGRAVVTPVPGAPAVAAAAAETSAGAALASTPPSTPGGAAGTATQAQAVGAVPTAVQERLSRAMAARAERAMRIVPIYRGVGRVETFPHFGNANRLLLATHGRLMWYRLDTGEVQVLHEGEVGAEGGRAPGGG